MLVDIFVVFLSLYTYFTEKNSYLIATRQQAFNFTVKW